MGLYPKSTQLAKVCGLSGKSKTLHATPYFVDSCTLFGVVNESIGERCVEKYSDFEKEASCQEFGHLCPVYFVSEPFTETSDIRNRKRNLSHATILRVVRRDNSTCQSCKKILVDKEIEIDHIIPYSRGGSSDESNFRVTCLECNRKKGKKVDL